MSSNNKKCEEAYYKGELNLSNKKLEIAFHHFKHAEKLGKKIPQETWNKFPKELLEAYEDNMKATAHYLNQLRHLQDETDYQIEENKKLTNHPDLQKAVDNIFPYDPDDDADEEVLDKVTEILKDWCENKEKLTTLEKVKLVVYYDIYTKLCGTLEYPCDGRISRKVALFLC